MHERSRAGIDAARRRGVRCGRAPLLTPEQRADVKRLALEGIRVTELAQRFGVSRANIYNVLHQSPPTPLPSTRA
jgi:DNA invertase Pin-like site-specific DNA recombinase